MCVSIVCLLGWFAFGVFFVSTMNRYSCTTLDWLLRLSSVCFFRVPAFVCLLAWVCFWRDFFFDGLNPPRVSTGVVE